MREGSNYPATYVSWDDAQAFCGKLSQLEKGKYRLPTEVEWEFACRGDTTTAFSFGDDEFELAEYGWFDSNAKAIGEPYAHEVALKMPNPLGLFDMHGNVSEWCADPFAKELPGGNNPLAASTEKEPFRVARGGAWFYRSGNCRSASRESCNPRDTSHYGGFRVAFGGSGK